MTRPEKDANLPASYIDQRWIKAGGDVIGQQVLHLPRPVAAALHTLPPPPTTLAGRAQDLQELLAELAPTPAETRSFKGAGEADQEQQEVNVSGGVVVSALAGMGGVGKTALALAAGAIAHHEQWFCAELFVDLRGYASGAQPLTAEAALDVLLRQTGADPKDIPAGVQERTSFYRSALAALTEADERHRPVLVVADNANSTSQVRPLLPGTGGHRLVATSRGGLHSLTGARHLDLDILGLEAAIALLTSDLSAHTPKDPRAHDDAGLARLAHLCGMLPLALEIAAAYLKRNPHLAPDRLADRLQNAASRVDKLTDPDRDAGQARVLRAVFDTSLAHLPPDQARVFLLVASAPGPTLGTSAAAALTDLPFDEVEEALEDLAAAHLLTQPAPGRWGAHDLLADYARTHPHPSIERDQALARLLDHYTTTTKAADTHLEALVGQPVPDLFPDRDTALGWLDAERATLVTAALAAPTLGHTATAIALALHLSGYLSLKRRFEDCEQLSRSAQIAAHIIGDQSGEASAWGGLGVALLEMRRFEEAIDAHTHARDIYRQVGDSHNEARAWGNLGLVLAEMRRFEEAIDALTRTRDAFHRSENGRNEATAWNNLGLALTGARRFKEAIDAHTHARDLHHHVGDPDSEALAWNNLGVALQKVGRFEEAMDAHTHARDLHHLMENAHGEAGAWNNLGLAFQELGRFEEAIDAHTHAHEAYHWMGDAHNEATAWTSLGSALQEVGRFEEAMDA
ncbi:tetratricopeptide repeat protein, partial [Nocardiopsis sp. NPDC055824]